VRSKACAWQIAGMAHVQPQLGDRSLCHGLALSRLTTACVAVHAVCFAAQVLAAEMQPGQ
jgi:hypothetical protein